MNTSTFPTSFVATTLASALWSGSVLGQVETRSLDVEDPRPVEAAVLSLIDQYPVAITYEDPRYEFPGDIEDVTDKVKTSNPNSPNRVLVPRGGILQASYQISSATGQPIDVGEVVQRILEAKNASPIGGRFEIHRSGGVVHIVPAEVRDKNGRWVKQQSILSAPITFSSGELSGYDLIEALLKRVTETNGAPILGLSAEGVTNSLRRYRGTIEAQDEPARDVLIRALHSISPRLTWVLNNDPGCHCYVFALVVAAEPLPAEIPLDLSILPRPGDPSPAGPLVEAPREN